MAQYPIDNNEDLFDAVNYLLSGPTSIGQNFEGMSAVGDPNLPYIGSPSGTFFTGTLIPAYTRDSTVDRWPTWSTVTDPIVINNITPQTVDGNILDIDYTLPASYDGTNNSTKPFVEGQLITVVGVTPAGFNGTYEIIDAPFATATITVIAAQPQTWPAYTSGGTIDWDYANQNRPTDCSAIVTVTGPTDRVFVSSQATTRFGWYDVTGYAGPVNMTINSRVNRYRSIEPTTLPDTVLDSQGRRIYNGYIWQYDGNLIDVPSYIPYTMAVGPQEHDMGTNIFNNIIDSPGIGHYWYVLEFYYDNQYPPGSAYPLYMITTNFRSFTAQVIKQ